MALNQTLLPLKDYHKSKRLAWDPQDLDLTQDRADYAAMTDRERELIRQALALFLGGEAAVTNDLSPLMIALKKSGAPLEETMFITAQLFEESKHVEFFDRILREVVQEDLDPTTLGGTHYTMLFNELDSSLGNLLTDTSLEAQAVAVTTYHMIIEGTLAETGYYGFFTALRARNLMPGLTRGLEYLQRDESRHVAFGLYLLSRLMQSDPQLWTVIENRLYALLPMAHEVFMETIGAFLPDIPFGLDLEALITYASSQFMARYTVLERAKSRIAVTA